MKILAIEFVGQKLVQIGRLNSLLLFIKHTEHIIYKEILTIPVLIVVVFVFQKYNKITKLRILKVVH